MRASQLMKPLLITISLTFGAASACSAQCTSQYVGSSFISSTAAAWMTLTDNYVNTSTNCAPTNWQAFTHTYSTTVILQSPTGRLGNNTGSGASTSGGGHVGQSTAYVSLSVPAYDGLTTASSGNTLLRAMPPLTVVSQARFTAPLQVGMSSSRPPATTRIPLRHFPVAM